MAQSMSLSLELSDRLLAAQREIHYVCTQLLDTEDTLRARQRIHVDQDSGFYSSDQDTWTTTSLGVGTGEEPPVDNRP
jgi:hypothetical protein